MIDFEKIGLNMCCPVCGKKIVNLFIIQEGEKSYYQEIKGSCSECRLEVKLEERSLVEDLDIRDRWNRVFKSPFKEITKRDIENIEKYNIPETSHMDAIFVKDNEFLSADASKYCEEKGIKVIRE